MHTPHHLPTRTCNPRVFDKRRGPEVPGAFDGVRSLVAALGPDRVVVISKARDALVHRTWEWMEETRFFERTGMLRRCCCIPSAGRGACDGCGLVLLVSVLCFVCGLIVVHRVGLSLCGVRDGTALIVCTHHPPRLPPLHP
jgi:hypothetical protein